MARSVMTTARSMLASLLQGGKSSYASEVAAKVFFVSVILITLAAVDFRHLVNALPDLKMEVFQMAQERMPPEP